VGADLAVAVGLALVPAGAEVAEPGNHGKVQIPADYFTGDRRALYAPKPDSAGDDWSGSTCAERFQYVAHDRVLCGGQAGG